MKMEAPNEMESARLDVFRNMSPALQQIAVDFCGKERAAAKGVALIKYDIGARLKDVVEREDVYGSDAIRQLTVYLGVSESDLYACLNVARKFTREQVEQCVTRPMSDGRYLSFHHLIHLAAIESERERRQFMEVAREAAWSTRQLLREMDGAGLVRTKRSAGGRKPTRPRSFLAAMQQMTGQMQGINHRFSNWTACGFDALDEIEPDKVDAMWVRTIEQTLNEVVRLRERLPEIKLKLRDFLGRAQQGLAGGESQRAGGGQQVGDDETEPTDESVTADD